MTWGELVWQGIFWGTGLGIAVVFAGYPLFLALTALLVSKKKQTGSQEDLPFVSMLVIFRNAGDLVRDKVENFLGLDYPADRLELILISDGSEDDTAGLADLARNSRIRVQHVVSHQGKISGLNTGISLCRGEIVVFSDVDAMAENNAVRHLVRHFSDQGIGGVCGQRVIQESPGAMGGGQKKYIQWDSAVKLMEMRLNMSVTSHDGKLYAIRKDLFRPVPPGVTDDAYVSLSIVRQERRFIFEPRARAFIRLPSKDTRHELERRRRIVSTSLRGLWLNRSLFNPMRYGFFAFGLFINKVVRRLVPFLMIPLFFSSLMLSDAGFYRLMIWIQSAGYGLALLHPFIDGRFDSWLGRKIKKLSGLAFFFCVGMAGTLWGVLGFLSGEKITKWEPRK